MFRPELDPWIVTGWDVRQFTYCPVIPWLRANYGVGEPPTYSMELGKQIGRDIKEEVARKLNLPKPWKFEISIEYWGLGLVGKVDILAGSRWFAVVEVKSFKRRVFEHFVNQLLFYAYLVSKVAGPVRYAYLVLSDEVLKYVITEYEVRKVEKLIRKVREVKISPKPPSPVDTSKCSSCWYRRYCSSILT